MAVYTYFGSMSGLVREMVHEGFARLERQFARLRQTDDPVADMAVLGDAEQVLLDKAMQDWPQVFTPDRLWIMDRNFPGVPRIQRMLTTGTHVLIHVKDGIKLPRIGDYAPDGCYPAALTGGGTKPRSLAASHPACPWSN